MKQIGVSAPLTEIERMSTQTRNTFRTSPTSTFIPPPTGLVQRKCDCGGAPGPSGECAECRKKRLTGDAQLPVQTKLTLGQPGDKYEQEADRVADVVMSMSEPRVQRQGERDEEEEEIQAKPLAGQITPLMQEELGKEDEEEEKLLQSKPLTGAELQRKEGLEEEDEEEDVAQLKTAPGRAPDVAPGLEAQINSLRGGGQPLDAKTRAFMEPRFGCSFANVRVHADGDVAELARDLNARAFTVGRDVAFGVGQYAPGSDDGLKLLAHELTHVVQQEHRAAMVSRLTKKVVKGQKHGTQAKEAWITWRDGAFLGKVKWKKWKSKQRSSWRKELRGGGTVPWRDYLPECLTKDPEYASGAPLLRAYYNEYHDPAKVSGKVRKVHEFLRTKQDRTAWFKGVLRQLRISMHEIRLIPKKRKGKKNPDYKYRQDLKKAHDALNEVMTRYRKLQRKKKGSQELTDIMEDDIMEEVKLKRDAVKAALKSVPAKYKWKKGEFTKSHGWCAGGVNLILARITGQNPGARTGDQFKERLLDEPFAGIFERADEDAYDAAPELSVLVWSKETIPDFGHVVIRIGGSWVSDYHTSRYRDQSRRGRGPDDYLEPDDYFVLRDRSGSST